jgi:antitoxin component YwqK of YwqJK toxin-antitoxin module
MKQIYLLLIISFFLVSIVNNSYALANKNQDNPKVNFIDDKGLKQGKWVFLGKDQPEKGFPYNGKIEEGTFKNDRKEGRWIFYYNDGMTPKTEEVFIDNRPNGEFIKYFPNGQIKERGTFSHMKYSNKLTRYNEKGIKIFEATFNDQGNEEGLVQHFYDNGNLELEYTAKNGIPSGKVTRYWPNGDIKQIIVFDENGLPAEISEFKEMENPEVVVKKPVKTIKKGPVVKSFEGFNPNGYNKVYNSMKELWLEGTFKQSQLWDGRVYIYDEDGLLLKIEVYKEGVFHSLGQL